MNVRSTSQSGPFFSPEPKESFALRSKSSFLKSIKNIIFLRSQKKVVRTHATAHIAMMANSDSFGDFSKVNHPRISMGGDFFLGHRISHFPVTSVGRTSRPKPTAITFGNIRPEAFLGSHKSHLVTAMDIDHSSEPPRKVWNGVHRLFRVLIETLLGGRIAGVSECEHEVHRILVGLTHFAGYKKPTTMAVNIVRRIVLRSVGFIGNFLRHNVRLSLSNVVFSGGRSATTDARYDYEDNVIGVNTALIYG